MNRAEEAQAFAAACGATLPLRLLVSDPEFGEERRITVERPFVLIGSAERCDVRLAHPDVSRNHAYLQVLAGGVLCCDLASRTGTYQGSEPRSRIKLQPGESIHVGPFSITLCASGPDGDFDAPDLPRRPPPEPRRPSKPNVRLTLLNAHSRSGRTEVNRIRNPVTLVGWNPQCNLRLRHQSISRVHCSLVWTDAGLWVVDLPHQRGTRVNGDAVEFARLETDDVLTLGRFRFQVACGPATIPADESALEAPAAAPLESLTGHSGDDLVLSDEPTQGEAEVASGPLVVSGAGFAGGLSRAIPPPQLAHLGAPPGLPSVVAAPPGAAAGVTMNEALVASMMQQFAQLQQQMFDHTHQVLAVVTETFQSAHNRQLQLIRDELVRVHELNRELTELHRQKVTAVPSSPAAAEPAGIAAPTAVSTPAAPRAIESAAPTLDAAPRSPPPTERLSSDTAVLSSGQTQAQAARDCPADQAPTPTPTPATSRPPKRAAKVTRPVQPGAAAKAPSAATETPPQDVHAWLSGRINELTQERTTRWQRILQLLSSGS